MIVPMMKYSFVLHHTESQAFLSQLQELGLVDIDSGQWTPDERERQLLADAECQARAVKDLGKRLKEKTRQTVTPFGSARETLDRYVEASARIEAIDQTIGRLTKEIAELAPWGDFPAASIHALEKQGVCLHFFTTYAKDFENHSPKWEEEYIVNLVSEVDGMVYFVVVTTPESAPLAIEALSVKAPVASQADKELEVIGLLRERKDVEATLERCAEGMSGLGTLGDELHAELHLSRVSKTTAREADGSLAVMTGWATKETAQQVDAFLDTHPAVIFFKDEPTQEDDPPVLLKNNAFASLFEVIGSLYALPKYGTIDLTAYFAPFYMLFFGFCLADAGYGLIYAVAALLLYRKVKPAMRPIIKLVLLCGISTIFFGLITGNVCGIPLAEQPIFAGLKDYFLTPELLFPISIGLGVIQLLYAMSLKTVLIAKTQGVKYIFPTLGWMTVIVSVLAAMLLPRTGVTGYTISSVAFYAVTGVGLFMMLFMNSPGKNPLVNLGAGLWNTYNDVTGFVGDVLSYIRLFALGISGGILALVFNRLAMGMSPDIIIVKQLVMLIILAIGQGLTIFMSTLSAFVHPLRLTFVEFYKNAGFEAGNRGFEPLKRT